MSLSDWIAAFALLPVGLLVVDRVRAWWGQRGIDVWIATHAERLSAAGRLDRVGEFERACLERRLADRQLAARLVADEIADSLLARHRVLASVAGLAYLLLASGYLVLIVVSWLTGVPLSVTVQVVICMVLLGVSQSWTNYTRGKTRTLRRRAEKIVRYRRVRSGLIV